MKSRKILAAAMAGLCAISTMGVSAFATVVDETIETSGAKSYKISAGFQAPTIDVTVPEAVLGVINPYKINVEIEGETFEAQGVASPKYTITNNSDEIGINVKATYSAEGLDGLVDAADKATDPTINTEKKKYAYVTLNAESPLDVTKTDTTASTADVQLEFSADATKPEKTDVLMRLNKKTAATDNEGKFWIGGDVIEEPTEKWSTADRLNINVVLDINPFNTGATTTTVTAATAMTALSITKSGTEKITGYAAATTTYTISGCAASDVYAVTPTVATGFSATYNFDTTTNASSAGTWTAPNATYFAGSPILEITITNDADNTDTVTYKVTFSA